MESRNKRTIYITNLHSTVTKEDLLSIFENFGVCGTCDLNLDSFSAYIEFDSEMSAEKALSMDNVEMGSSPMRVVIAFEESTDQQDPETTYTVTSKKIDYLKPIQIFIGGIGFNVDENVLREGFSQFGKIVEVKVVRQADGTHKGYAFVSYSTESEAETAIQTMNNTMFHNRKIQCNWAAKNNAVANSNVAINGSNRVSTGEPGQKTVEEISIEAPESNTSVYVVAEHLTEELLQSCFERFGKIKNIKSFPERNHAFINYESHDSAAYAIQQLHGQTINNNIELKCSWSKKSADQNKFDKQNKPMRSGYLKPNQQPCFNNYPGAQFGGQFDQFYGANYAMGPYMGQQYGMAAAAAAAAAAGVAPMAPGYYNNMQFGAAFPQQNRFQSHARPQNNFVAHRQNRMSHPYRQPQNRPSNRGGANNYSNQQQQQFANVYQQ